MSVYVIWHRIPLKSHSTSCNNSITPPLGLGRVLMAHTEILTWEGGVLWRLLSHLMVFVLISSGITITLSRALNAALRPRGSLVSFHWPYRTLWHIFMSRWRPPFSSGWWGGRGGGGEGGGKGGGGGGLVGWLVVGLVQVVSKRTAWYSQTQTPGILWPLRNAIYGIYPHGPIKRITIFGNNFSNLLALRNSRGLDAAVRGQMRRLACR